MISFLFGVAMYKKVCSILCWTSNLILFIFVRSSIIEYDAEGFNEVSLLLKHGSFFFILYGKLIVPFVISSDGLFVFLL